MFSSDYQDFNDQLEQLNNSYIIEQVPSYSKENNQSFIRLLENEIEQQLTINKILESNDTELKNHMDKIKNFTKNNDEIIEKQLNKITEVVSILKNLVIRNNNLKENRNELNTFQESSEYQKVANNILEIKKQKHDILNFLKNMKIIIPEI